jgi:Cu-Zn family superoxide dismutase
MKNAEGADVGMVELVAAPRGILMRGRFKALPPGVHAFHIHEVGKCEPPFTSAGGHFNPQGHEHGLMNPKGRHAGDLPNLTVPGSGGLDVEVFVSGVALAAGQPGNLLDADGSALVIHAGPDDYRSDPAGNAGGRIACGVVVGR